MKNKNRKNLFKRFSIKPCVVKLEMLSISMIQAIINSTNSCLVQLKPFYLEMSEPVVKRRPGRPSKAAMAAAAAAAASTPKTKPAPNSATTTPKDGADKASAKKTPANKRAATAALDDSVNLSGGRSKRTPKPNPKYMDDVVFNATKALKEDSTESDLQDDEIEGNLSSDDYRAPSDMPLKKRSLHQKTFMQKKSQGNTPGRKPTVALKRKSGDAEINIDGDDARQLFLAAKRQYTHVSFLI